MVERVGGAVRQEGVGAGGEEACMAAPGLEEECTRGEKDMGSEGGRKRGHGRGVLEGDCTAHGEEGRGREEGYTGTQGRGGNMRLTPRSLDELSHELRTPLNGELGVYPSGRPLCYTGP